MGSGLIRRLPLLLTLLRFLLAPAFVVAYRCFDGAIPLFVIVGLAIVTDWFDGLTARRFGAVTSAGKLLDPFADGVFCMVVFADFAAHGRMAWWMVIVLIAREALVTLVLRPVALWRGLVIAASVLGKIKTILQFFGMLLVLLGVQLGEREPAFLKTTIEVVFYLVIFFSLAALGVYCVKVVGALRKGRSADSEGSCD